MKRDFSESAKNKLLGYVADVTETSNWGKIGDAISDVGLYVSHWLGFLNIKKYVNDLDSYHKKIIDKNNTTANQIEDIFSNVAKIDSRYKSGMSSEKNYLNKMVKLINDLGKTINPSGGNIDMSKMESVLQADVDEIISGRATTQNIIESENLGSEPIATPTSVDPVNLATGNFIYEYRDLSFAGENSLFFHRYYNSKDVNSLSLGKGFRHNFDISLKEIDDEVDIVYEDGRHVRFTLIDNIYYSNKTAEDYLKKIDNQYRLYRLDGISIIFDELGKMVRLENSNSVGASLQYSEGKLVKVINDFGDYFVFTYDDDNMLCKIEDSANRAVFYSYSNGRLVSSKYSYGKIINYNYSLDGKISEIFIGDERPNIVNEYDKQARVVHQKFGDGSEMFFEYDDERKSVTQTERNGIKTVFFHDDEYRNTRIVYFDNSTEEYLFNEKGQCIKHTDRLGNSERMSYDNRGNLVQRIDGIRRRTNFTYDINNNLMSISINGKVFLRNYYDKKGNLLSTENAIGNKNIIKYDEFGRVVKVTTPDGGTEEYSYNDRGDIVSYKNHFGGVTNYEYDNLHRVIRIVNPSNGESRYAYGDDGSLASETNEDGNIKCYYYNEKGLLTKTIDFNGGTTEREYNELNKLKAFVDECGKKTLYFYDKMWNISKVTFPDGAETKYLYDRDNNLSEVIDALGGTTHFKYDLNGNCIGEERDGVCSKFYYDSVGRKVKIQYLNGTSCRYEYDMFDNLIHIDNEDGIQVYMEYDDANNMIKQSNSEGEVRIFTYTEDGKIQTIEDEYGRVTKYSYVPGEKAYSKIVYPNGSEENFFYDISGNLIKYIDRYGNVIEGKYDTSNRLVENHVNEVLMKRISYDAMGNIKEVIDAEGKSTKYSYSLKNELIKLENAEGSTIEYTYNENGRLLYKIDKTDLGTRETKFEYDMLDRLVKCIDPCGNVEQFEYDSFDNLISKCDKDGMITKYSYTASGKVHTIEYSDGKHASFEYDKHDYLCKVRDWTGVTEINNDACGRALVVIQPDGNKICYAYNSAGKRTMVQYPSGKKVKYEYDSLLRINKLETDEQIINYSYDKFGRIIRKDASVGIKTEYSYNSVGLLESLTNIHNNDLLDSIEYEYDIYGRKVLSKKYRSDNSENNGVFTYGYDELGRLKLVSKDGESSTEYCYDAFGNRTAMISREQRTEYSYNNLNQLIESSDGKDSFIYKYDGRGNLISITSQNGIEKEFAYGSINRLERASNNAGEYAEYEYNALGYRVAKKTNTLVDEKYIIDLTKQYDNLIETQSNNVIQDYVWDTGLAFIDNRIDGEKMYCSIDDLGSPIRLFDKKANTLETYDYDVFGQEARKRNMTVNPFTFIGYQKDSVSDFYFAQAREYLPMEGRFAARDLVAGKADSINSQNEYLYCENDPNDFVDKNGLFLLTAIVIDVAVGAATNAAINGVSQGIKIAQGKQDSFKWGEFVGSTVEGAIIGGVGAIPGLGPAASLAVKVGGSAVGAAANSLISQGIDDGKVDAGKVGEDTLAGAVFGAISFGIDKGLGAVKTKIFGKDTTKTTAKSVYKELDKATGGLKNAQSHYDAVIKSGHKPSSLTRKTLENSKSEVSDLSRKYFKVWGKEKAMSFVKGKSGILRSSVRTLFGYKTVKQVSKEAFKKWLPWSSDGQDNVLEYLDDYYGRLIGKVTGKCPIYV